MTDNVSVTPGSGAAIATDDVGGVHYQRVKLDAGGDGVAVPLVAGAQVTAASLPVVIASDDARIGILTETAPATDTASSGLNGRLQRIAQRLTSLIALLPASLGAKAGAASLSVVPATDAAFTVSQPGLSGGILQSVTTVGTAAVALPATPLAGRATMLVQNVGATTIYLGSSTVVASTAAAGGIQLLPGQSVPISLAAAVILYAISSAAGGLVACLELAA